MQPEARLVNRIRKWLEAQEAFTVKIHGGGNPWQEAGIPDILCCFRGLFIAVECKMPGNKLSPLQERMRSRIVQADGIYIVAYSLDDVREAFRSLLRRRR